MLVGRQAERARIGRLLDDARLGRGGALVIRGEPGIGKTSLLRHAVDLAEAMSVARAVGVESEAELEYSGLIELCRPLLSGLDGLPEHQAETLRGALGLSSARPGDRFTVGAALLGLLALAAESRPLLVVVDDGQWLDAASLDALSFAARRLGADPVAFVAATREGSEAFASGFDELALEGLDPDSATRLLEDVADGEIAPEVSRRLVEETRGNPLGLVELPRVLSPEQLAGASPVQSPIPVGSGVERTYSASIGRLPEPTREALVVLALSTSGELDLLAGALSESGGVAALEPAEDERLVELRDGGFVFRHPLVRSAIVQAAPPSARREAHRALAAAFAERGDVERRAWHLGEASVGPDEAAAEALAAVAATARDRGGFEAASLAFERSARLSTVSELRVERLIDAAEAAWSVGDTARAATLADEALASADDVRLRARLLRLRGRMELQAGSSSRAQELFLEGADMLEPGDPLGAVGMLALGVFACHFRGRISEAVELSRRARALAPEDGSPTDLDADYVLGRSLLLSGELAEGTAALERVLERVLALADVPRAALVRAAITLTALERGREAGERAREAVERARQEGPMLLTYGLDLTAELAVRHGRWRLALASIDEGLPLAQELGQPAVAAQFTVVRARVTAARGQEAECREAAAEALAILEASGMALAAENVACSLGLLELGLGRLEDAALRLEEAARRVGEMGLHDREVMPEPDLVEALVGLGRADDAGRVLEAWLERGAESATLVGAALASRCSGLLAEDDAFDSAFAEALERHGLADDPFGEARTRLCHGERLRRAGHRVEARPALRAALEVFEGLEAEPWLKRARRELRATGEKLGRRAARSGDELTAQELQVALQVAEGKTNREVGAALYLSPKTVEFHLARVYRKLDLSSRAELIRRFAESSSAGEPLA